MQIGVLGGTFDPPHIGHLILGQEALDQCNLDRVLWLPAADPPHKKRRAFSPIADRIELVSLSIADNEHFSVSRVDVDRPGPHYTADTLDLLISQFSGAEWFLLLGSDSLRDLPTWYAPQELIKRAKIVVMARPGATYDMTSLEQTLPGITSQSRLLDTPLIDISSHDIRLRRREGRSIRYLVTDSVRGYIIGHDLYLHPPTE